MARRQTQSYNSSDKKQSTPFYPQRVVSFQLFHQKQKSRFRLLYPFLTAEQINLKIKEKWKHLDDSQKQDYTKAVLYTTPVKKSFSKSTSSKSKYSVCNKKALFSEYSEKSALITSPKSVISSQEKVEDWLNDPKQSIHQNNKKYDGMQYAVNYGIPDVINNDTSEKLTGILKNKGHSSETKFRPKNESKVSFSSRRSLTYSDLDENKRILTVKSMQNGQSIKRQSKTLIKENDVFDIDEIGKQELHIGDEKTPELEDAFHSKMFDKRTLQNKKRMKKYFNFKKDDVKKNSDIKREITITEENKKRKSQITNNRLLQYPQKFKSEESIKENTETVGSTILDKQFPSQKDNQDVRQIIKHKQNTENPSQKQKPSPRPRKMPDILENSNNSQYDTNSVDSSSFYRSGKGLLIGPLRYDNEDCMSVELSSNSDNNGYCSNKNPKLIVGPLASDKQSFQNMKGSSPNKEKSISVDEVFSRETKTYAQSHKKQSGNPQKLLTSKTVSSTAGKLMTTEKAKFENRSPLDSVQIVQEINGSKKRTKGTLDKDNVHKSKAMKSSRRNVTEVTPFAKSPQSHFGSEESSLSSVPWEIDVHDVNHFEDQSKTNSSHSPEIVQSRSALSDVLSRMKDITSPEQILTEHSPKLLSPSLSGISQLSSFTSDNSEKLQMHENNSSLRNTKLKDITQLPNISGKTSHIMKKKQAKQNKANNNSLRRFKSQNEEPTPKHSTISKTLKMNSKQDNLLWDMFEDILPPKKKMNKSKRPRLVADNSEANIPTFANMFDENDIFM